MLSSTADTDYTSVEYWDGRYKTEDSYEWFQSYSSFAHIIRDVVKKSDRILMLGCGNSTLSEDMFQDGFQRIVNIDFSNVVIAKMGTRSAAAKRMGWHVMDAKRLSFPDGHFDVVMEKGTVDAIVSNNRDPWNLEPRIRGEVHAITTEPHFRIPMYAQPAFDWSVEKTAFGDSSDCFGYFAYVMRRGRPLSVPDYSFLTAASSSTTTTTTTLGDQQVCHSDNEDYLLAIDDDYEDVSK